MNKLILIALAVLALAGLAFAFPDAASVLTIIDPPIPG
jgi:hypothetical protein